MKFNLTKIGGNFVRRWLKSTFKIGLKRAIQEDDIYAVTEHMESARNTQTYTRLWNLELEKQKPSILRVIFKIHLHKLMIYGALFAIIETLVRYVSKHCHC